MIVHIQILNVQPFVRLKLGDNRHQLGQVADEQIGHHKNLIGLIFVIGDIDPAARDVLGIGPHFFVKGLVKACLVRRGQPGLKFVQPVIGKGGVAHGHDAAAALNLRQGNVPLLGHPGDHPLIPAAFQPAEDQIQRDADHGKHHKVHLLVWRKPFKHHKISPRQKQDYNGDHNQNLV